MIAGLMLDAVICLVIAGGIGWLYKMKCAIQKKRIEKDVYSGESSESEEEAEK